MPDEKEKGGNVVAEGFPGGNDVAEEKQVGKMVDMAILVLFDEDGVVGISTELGFKTMRIPRPEQVPGLLIQGVLAANNLIQQQMIEPMVRRILAKIAMPVPSAAVPAPEPAPAPEPVVPEAPGPEPEAAGQNEVSAPDDGMSIPEPALDSVEDDS